MHFSEQKAFLFSIESFVRLSTYSLTLRLTYKGFPKIVQPSKTLIFGQIFSLSTLTKTLIGFCFSPETLMSQYHQHNPINTYCSQSMQCVGLSFHKLKIPLVLCAWKSPIIRFAIFWRFLLQNSGFKKNPYWKYL